MSTNELWQPHPKFMPTGKDAPVVQDLTKLRRHNLITVWFMFVMSLVAVGVHLLRHPQFLEFTAMISAVTLGVVLRHIVDPKT